MIIRGYEFQGPFRAIAQLRDEPGIYAILARRPTGPAWTFLDVASTEDIRASVRDGERREMWSALAKTKELLVAVYYTGCAPAYYQEAVVKLIRRDSEPLCQ